jgi:hypothetical protein
LVCIPTTKAVGWLVSIPTTKAVGSNSDFNGTNGFSRWSKN